MCSPLSAKVVWRHFILEKGIQTKYLTLLSQKMKLWNLMTKDFFFLHFLTVCLEILKKAYFSDQQQSWKQTMKDVCVCVCV